MIILTLNCGSSSLKYQLYNWKEKEILANGIVERIGIGDSFIKHTAGKKGKYKKNQECPTHKEAIELMLKTIMDKTYGVIGDLSDIKAAGHRVVHGGEEFSKSVLITDSVISAFKKVQDLSPLHNPANIMGIESAQKVLSNIPHCAIIDTAWHQTMPEEAYLYALPYEWYTKYGVRKYGFHGTSFLFTAKRAAVLLKRKTFDTNLIIAHIGNGSSINAVKNGVSVDTSMGLTPLEGLIMGTRCGDIDPAIPFYIMDKTKTSPEEMEKILNKKSGVFGITQKWIDRREIEIEAEKGNERAVLSEKMEAYRIRKYIGAYMAVLGRVDAVVFTAGVGEMGASIRKYVLSDMDEHGIILDPEKNKLAMTRNAETEISKDGSRTKIFVIPTDEELVMTEDTHALLEGRYDIHTNFTYSFQNKGYVNKERRRGLEEDLEKLPELKRILADSTYF